MTPCSTASELYEQGGLAERGRDRERERLPRLRRKRDTIWFCCLWVDFFSKKSAAWRYWSNISVSLVSTAINLFVSTAEPDNAAVLLSGFCCFMDHIGNSKEQQSSYYLTLYELSHPRQISHLWKELASHLSLLKWAVFPQVQSLNFFSFSHFWKCVWHAIYWCVVFLFSYFFCLFKRSLFVRR